MGVVFNCGSLYNAIHAISAVFVVGLGRRCAGRVLRLVWTGMGTFLHSSRPFRGDGGRAVRVGVSADD